MRLEAGNHFLQPRYRCSLVGARFGQRFLGRCDAGLHPPLIQDAPQEHSPEQKLEQPRHVEGSAVERCPDEIGQVIANLRQVPLAELLVALAVQLIELGEDLSEVGEIQATWLHGEPQLLARNW